VVYSGKTAFSIRWGASPGNKGKYLKHIPKNEAVESMASQKLPGGNWRTKDPGHFHLKNS